MLSLMTSLSPDFKCFSKGHNSQSVLLQSFFWGGRCLFQETSLVSAFFSSDLPSAPVNSSTNHLLCDLLHYVSTSLTQCVIFMELAFLGGGERKGRRGFIKIMRLSFALKCSKFPSYKLTVWRSSFQNWLGS